MQHADTHFPNTPYSMINLPVSLAFKQSHSRHFTAAGWLGLLALVGSLWCATAQAEAPVIEGQDGWLFPGWEGLTTVDKPGIDAVIALLRATREQLLARKVELLVLVAPMKAPYYPERLPAGMAVSTEVRERYGYIFMGLERAGIATFDDQAVLKVVQQGGQDPFYRADYHWTAWGAEASAASAAELIRKRWKLEGNVGGGSPLGNWINERHYGDLAINFLQPAQVKTIGRDVYTVRSTETQQSKLLDDAPSTVHVLGNSFVQPYFGFPQKLSNALDRPVSLTWNPGNVGPWATALQYFESPEFLQHKPQVIVWQFNEGQMQNGPGATGKWDLKSIVPTETWRSRMAAAIAK